MPLLQKGDLKFEYSWKAIPPDDPRVTGKPDSTLLSRGEGYEVLGFINRVAEANKWTNKASGLKVERLINKHLPDNVRSHKNVWQWLVDNWSKHD